MGSLKTKKEWRKLGNDHTISESKCAAENLCNSPKS